jgi:cation-transporting ATPase 13A1
LEEGRDQFDLLLHCIMIVTSVVPPELNMHLALAVNSSILTLIKVHVFCTEPFRVVLAGRLLYLVFAGSRNESTVHHCLTTHVSSFTGKIDVCLFDKTGTITTDELVADRVVAETKVCGLAI